MDIRTGIFSEAGLGLILQAGPALIGSAGEQEDGIPFAAFLGKIEGPDADECEPRRTTVSEGESTGTPPRLTAAAPACVPALSADPLTVLMNAERPAILPEGKDGSGPQTMEQVSVPSRPTFLLAASERKGVSAPFRLQHHGTGEPEIEGHVLSADPLAVLMNAERPAVLAEGKDGSIPLAIEHVPVPSRPDLSFAAQEKKGASAPVRLQPHGTGEPGIEGPVIDPARPLSAAINLEDAKLSSMPHHETLWQSQESEESSAPIPEPSGVHHADGADQDGGPARTWSRESRGERGSTHHTNATGNNRYLDDGQDGRMLGVEKQAATFDPAQSSQKEVVRVGGGKSADVQESSGQDRQGDLILAGANRQESLADGKKDGSSDSLTDSLMKSPMGGSTEGQPEESTVQHERTAQVSGNHFPGRGSAEGRGETQNLPPGSPGPAGTAAQAASEKGGAAIRHEHPAATVPASGDAGGQDMVLRKVDGTTIEVSIEPEGMGSLDVEVTVEKGVIHGAISAADPIGKDLIERNLHSILDAMAREGLSVGGFSVSLRGRQGDMQRNTMKHDISPDEKPAPASVPSERHGGISIFI